MSNLLIITTAFIIFGSVATLANPALTEFERGLVAGQKTCVSELWSCSTNDVSVYVDEYEISSQGDTRAHALKALIDSSNKVGYENILAGKVKCKKL